MKIDQLISDFSPVALILFFRQKLSSFKPEHEDYFYLFDDTDEINEN